MNNERYKEYLQSDDWKELKAKVISRDRGICQGCFADNLPLDVHHENYDRIGEELGIDLVSLCRKCHDKIHGKNKTSISGGEWHKYIKGLTSKKPINFSELSKDDQHIYILKGSL